MVLNRVQRIAVIGAGIAGATCAHSLTKAGHFVHVFDKSRGPGGRLATRRVEWIDRKGHPHVGPFDHGAVGITAKSTLFKSFIDSAFDAGWLAEWTPRRPASEGGSDRLYVPVSNMPSLCRQLLQGTVATWSFAADGLVKAHNGSSDWQVHAAGEHYPLYFDSVLLAVPPAQAAPLLEQHRFDWARRASSTPMQPCWTLMGVAEACPESGNSTTPWDMAQPSTGPLALLLRNDARPGRTRVPGQAQWIAHASADWSKEHLEQPAAWILQRMQAALAEYLGRSLNWYHCVVHRWRYATPALQATEPHERSWWDATQGLGVCGDFFGGSGVESAWLSARSLCTSLLQGASDQIDPADICAAHGAHHDLDRQAADNATSPLLS
jgi:renalase